MKKIVLLLMCVFVLLCGCGKNEKGRCGYWR